MGRDVAFIMRSGHEFEAKRRRDGMLYDETGKHWSKDSLLVAPFEQGEDEVEGNTRAREFFGSDFAIYRGGIYPPPSSLKNGWRSLGEVKTIYYDRAGKYEGPFKHEFNKPRGIWRLIFLFDRRAKGPALLYARKGCYRVEFPKGALIDSRGIAIP
jgi:hypothetical protein